MLSEFLKSHTAEILALSEEKTADLAGIRLGSDELKQGLPLFFGELIKVLEVRLSGAPSEDMVASAAIHGKEFLRLGFSLSHVVHAYGAMCQAITEIAVEKDAKISTDEFRIFNSCLDVAIAAAVSEFHFQSVQASEELEVKHLGFLAHELRNALSSATVAHEMITAGLVGTGGSTAKVLEANLARMRNLIDRSLSEVRMRADADVFIETFSLFQLLDQIVVTAAIDAKKKNQTLTLDGDSLIELTADRQFILSAVANIVQNALKYTKSNGHVHLSARPHGERVIIQIADECGGIDAGKMNALFEPYVQASDDRSGLGLGLSISRRAIALSHGEITVENRSPGCVFTINIPRVLVASASTKVAVAGKDSLQPDFRSRK